jgi:hypothetical protein
MARKTSGTKSRKYQPSDLVDPRPWINRQSYAGLKEWLREATQQRIYLPVVIPHNVMPIAYLTQLLIQSEPQTKTHLRIIIPELIREWGANDEPQSLDDLLILCGNLNCNEAENAIGRIITEKLPDNEVGTRLRLRALSVLQEIGTDRSLHIFKRYIGDRQYAALCYRSLYLLNMNHAVTELEGMMKLYRHQNADDALEDILKILFKYTLKMQQYICVLQPLVDQAPPETFVDALELLSTMNIMNRAFFRELPTISRVELIAQIMKRGTADQAERISMMLGNCGLKVVPPPGPIGPESLDETEGPATSAPGSEIVGSDLQFMLEFNDQTSSPEPVPLITTAELGKHKFWPYYRLFEPDVESVLED